MPASLVAVLLTGASFPSLRYSPLDLVHGAIAAPLPGNADVKLSGPSIACTARLAGARIVRTDRCAEFWDAADPLAVTIELQGRAVASLVPERATPLQAQLAGSEVTLPGKTAGEAAANVVAAGKSLSGWHVIAAAASEQIMLKDPVTADLVKAKSRGGRLVIASTLSGAGAATWSAVIPQEVIYSPLDLANRSIPLPGAPPQHATAKLQDGTQCLLTIDQMRGITRLSSTDCPALWDAEVPPKAELTLASGPVRLTPAPLQALEGLDAAVADDGSVQLPATVKGPVAVLPPRGAKHRHWVTVPLGASKTATAASAPLAAQIGAARGQSGGTLLAVANAADSTGLLEWSFALDARAPPVDTVTASEDEKKKFRDGVTECGESSKFVMVIDATRTTPVRTKLFGGDDLRSEVEPNQPFGIAVIVSPNIVVHVSSKGSAGDFGGTVMNAPAPTGTTTSFAAARVVPVVTCARFAPRVPGDATVKLSLGRVGSDGVEKKGDDISFDLFVRTAYSGALRFGISAIGKGIDHSYVARTIPGSQVSTVLDDGAPKVNFELVVGYAPFIFETLFFQGRTYGDHATPRLLRFAPYAGLGLVSPTAGSGIDWLKTIYVGGEYEFFPNFSVAVTFVERRTTHLAPGLAVGGPAPDGGQLTTTHYEPGWAVVLNITPDFLRFGSMTLPK